MKKVIVITGPTGVGKTNLSISLAKKLNGEIINADSMQVYKGLDIGTAKIKHEEMQNIPHHLFDIIEPTKEYSVYNYQFDARKKIDEVICKGKIPILVGGTAFYIKSVLYDYKFNEEKKEEVLEKLDIYELYDKLKQLDPNIVIDKNNKRRLIRAINYYINNNSSINDNKTDKILYDAIIIGLTTERSKLYNIINNRVDKMIDNGLINEVKDFYDNNIYSKPLLNGIGYKELYKVFKGEVLLEEAVDEIKKNSRHYAKRQYTYLNNQLNVSWFNVDFDNFNKTINEVYNYIKTKM